MITWQHLVSFRKTGGSKQADGTTTPTEFRISGWKLSPEGLTFAWENEPVEVDENLHFASRCGAIWAIGKGEIQILNPVTGAQLAGVTTWPKGHHGPGSNSWVGLVSGKMIISPGGQHGCTDSFGTARLRGTSDLLASFGFRPTLRPRPTMGSPWSRRSCIAGSSCAGEMESTATT